MWNNWIGEDIQGLSMRRINGYPVYQLGLVLGGLTAGLTENQTVAQVGPAAIQAQNILEGFLNDPTLVIPYTKDAGGVLLAQIKALVSEEDQARREAPLAASPHAAGLFAALWNFQAMLSAEMARLDLYFVSPKRAYDMSKLIGAAEQALPMEVLPDLPTETRDDLREAGRCLAFELPTATGFHVFRAVESIVRIYFPLVGVALPKSRNLGGLIDSLEGTISEKTIGMLKHLKDTYRNPLMHPELVLDLDEAESLFQFSISAISTMMAEQRELREKKAPVALKVVE